MFPGSAGAVATPTGGENGAANFSTDAANNSSNSSSNSRPAASNPFADAPGGPAPPVPKRYLHYSKNFHLAKLL